MYLICKRYQECSCCFWWFSVFGLFQTIMDKMFGTLLRFQLQKTKKPLTPPIPRSMLNYWITTHSLGCQWVTSTLYGGERGEFVTKDCCEGLKVAYSRKLVKKWSNIPDCPKTFCPWLKLYYARTYVTSAEGEFSKGGFQPGQMG